jgi:NB-ARC domain
MGENLSPDPFVSELRVEGGGKAVIAGRVENLNLYTQAGSAFSSIDPFATVPPLPPNFISRPEITEPIIESLSNSDTVALTAIEGMGGIGKTIIANEICHDPRVRKAFPDGILWFAIGKQSGVTRKT